MTVHDAPHHGDVIFLLAQETRHATAAKVWYRKYGTRTTHLDLDTRSAAVLEHNPLANMTQLIIPASRIIAGKLAYPWGSKQPQGIQAVEERGGVYESYTAREVF